MSQANPGNKEEFEIFDKQSGRCIILHQASEEEVKNLISKLSYSELDYRKPSKETMMGVPS